MLYAGISLTANTMGSIALFFLFRAQGILPQLGIALATTFGGWINTFLLWRTLVARNQFVADRRLRRALPIIVLASAVMGLMLFLIEQYLVSDLLVDQSLLKRAAGLTILVVSGFASYVSAVTGVGLMRTAAARQT
jgi:putative peptidoglycan lipid II flippase